MAAGSGILMRGIGKRFGDVQALDRVDFTRRRNEVHVLAGENGAGKTTGYCRWVALGLVKGRGFAADDDRVVAYRYGRPEQARRSGGTGTR